MIIFLVSYFHFFAQTYANKTTVIPTPAGTAVEFGRLVSWLGFFNWLNNLSEKCWQLSLNKIFKFIFTIKLNQISHRSFSLDFNNHLYWCIPSLTLFTLLYTILCFRPLQENFFWILSDRTIPISCFNHYKLMIGGQVFLSVFGKRASITTNILYFLAVRSPMRVFHRLLQRVTFSVEFAIFFVKICAYLTGPFSTLLMLPLIIMWQMF